MKYRISTLKWSLNNLSYFEHIPLNLAHFLFWKECLVKIFIWLRKFYHGLKWSPWILTNDLRVLFMLCGFTPTHFLATFLQSIWVLFRYFLAKVCIFLPLFENHLTSKHFYSYWKPSSTAVCFSLVTSPIPLDLGNLSRIYSFPMFSYSISCSVWCKTDFKVHNRTEVNMKDSRILAFGFCFWSLLL